MYFAFKLVSKMNTTWMLARVDTDHFSERFCASCKEMEFNCIDDILKIPPTDLIGKKGFSYHWLRELIEFLKAKKALHLLQQLPGSTGDQ